MKKIGLIINPHARYIKRMKKDPAVYFQNIGGDITDVRVTSSIDDIDPVLKDFKKLSLPYIAVCGGDGTQHHIMSRMIKVYKGKDQPALLHLRAGTMNTPPRTLHLKGKPPRILGKLVSALYNGDDVDTRERDTIRVGGRYCFLFGVGMTANFLAEYYRGKGLGPKKAVKTILLAARGAFWGAEVGTLFDRINARILIDGVEVPHRDFLALLAGTVDDIGIGFRPLFRAYEQDGSFHVISLGCEVKDVVSHLYKVKTGKPLNHPHYYESTGKRIEIISDTGLLYTMDGDLYESDGTLTAEAGPRVKLVYMSEYGPDRARL